MKYFSKTPAFYILQKSLIIGVILILLASCGPSKHYRLASEANSTEAYEAFIKRYPNARESIYAQTKLNILYEQESFQRARRINSIDAYRGYLKDYPRGKFAEEARSEIIKIERLQKEERDRLEWEKVLGENSLSSFQRYLSSNPNSKYATNARSKIQEIDKKEWEKASRLNSKESYEDYLRLLTNGSNSSEARRRIKQIEDERYILPIWTKTQKTNTYQAYKEFYDSHRNSSYAYQAKQKMDSFDYSAWNTAKSSNSIGAYQRYISSYPQGNFVNDANKRIIDLEVENIFKGDYGYLPPMTKKTGSVFGNTRPTTNKISVFNNTSYTLTVWYSGPESKKIVLNPGRKINFELVNGSYKVAASVNAANVTKYAGNERLDGGDFESEFYIQTRRGF